MNVLRWAGLVLAGAWLLALAPAAKSQVAVTVDGNTAYATISLPDGQGGTYDADVTIVFDAPLNLSPASLNLTAEVVTADDVASRLGPFEFVPEFPVLITVEPPNSVWLFRSDFDGDESGTGNLAFFNTYQFEVHTHDLEYTPSSTYRLIKAPLGGSFDDITSELAPGSMRARGRGAAFSQFLIAEDFRPDLIVSTLKLVALDLRIAAAILGDVLRADLVALIAKLQVLIIVNVTGAVDVLDQLIDLIELHAGVDIANEWRAERDLVNDAGDILSLAQTLRFTLVRRQEAPAAPQH